MAIDSTRHPFGQNFANGLLIGSGRHPARLQPVPIVFLHRPSHVGHSGTLFKNLARQVIQPRAFCAHVGEPSLGFLAFVGGT